MAKQKINPLAIALIIIALALTAVTAKYLIDAYAPSSTDRSTDELNKKLEEVRKNRK